MHAAIVDPSGVVRRVTADLFAQRGDRVSLFSDAHEALECLQNERSINLLLTSLEVTPISGLELCWHARLIAGASRPLHILVMSSFNDSDNLAKALDSGADDLIAKPVSRSMLYAKLRLAERLQFAQLELARLAETDTVADVLNRRAFMQRLDALLQGKDGSEPIWVLMLDIDQFKLVNDTEGDEAGDDIIRTVGIEAGRFSQVVGRLSGKEFGLIIQAAKREQAMQVADNLRKRCAERVFKGEYRDFSVTACIGLSRLAPDDTPKLLLKRAEIALSEARTAGGNRVKMFEAGA